ncbi:uncharacterized protein [Littorina saxatilis]|uniref:G-protein coupled receptors family 1 profile domain-containing protein n=1 Tax=Littorina saxatilis TaxID=31220 RepID=A0AAN9BI41_9CAEN
MPKMVDTDLTGTDVIFNAKSVRSDSADSDVESVTLAVQIIPVVFLLAGIVGNIVTVVALFSCKELSAGCRTYHTNLCIADLGALLLSTLRLWLLALIPLDLYTVHPALCRVMPWLEGSAVMTPPWILVAMVMQVQEGLKKNHAPGANITRWKALVYSATVVAVSLVFNSLRIFTFTLKDLQHQGNDNDASNKTSGAWESSHSDLPEPAEGCSCVPTSEDFSVFFSDIWPWLSLLASSLFPLIILIVGFVVIMRRVCLRCRRSDHVTTSPANFTTMTVSVQVQTCFVLLTTFLFCGLSLSDAGLFWTDYGAFFVSNGLNGKEKEYSLSCVFRLIFNGQFAVRWFVTCCCCQMWGVVARMCRKNNAS